MINNKEMILTAPFGSHFIADKLNRIVEMVNRPVNLLRQYYAQVLERELNMRQTWSLIEAQTAFFLGVMPVGYAFPLRAAALVWLIVAVRKCRQQLA
ncbi:MAG: hypothetical protein IKX65_09055 [Prevotella sp.]|nr:hypothetical protein [Prevotella sp.]